MVEERGHREKPSRWRRIFWMLAGALMLTVIGKALIPNLAVVGQERIALIGLKALFLTPTPP